MEHKKDKAVTYRFSEELINDIKLVSKEMNVLNSVLVRDILTKTIKRMKRELKC